MTARLHKGKDRRQHQQRCQGGRREPADHGPPSGAVCCPASPKPSAIGIMPAIIARLVIKMGRKRLCAPSTAAASAAAPPRRLRSANVTRRIAFATATPIAMIAPMND